MTSLTNKPWWASKTIWVNIIAAVAAISTAFGLDLGLDAEQQTAIVGGVMAVVNVGLRLVTTAPVAVRPQTSGKLRASVVAAAAAMALSLLMLAACASQVAETPAQRVYALQADYNAALAAAVAYESQPRCEEGEWSGCSDPEAVAQIRRADDHAHDALQAAQSTVRGAAGGDGVETALIAAREAVGALRRVLEREGVIR
jgi:hypothetical protein